MTGFVAWEQDGWRGWRAAPGALDDALDAGALLAAAASGAGRASRHARSLAWTTGTRRVWIKSYPAPAGRRARRAFAMGRALAAAGFRTPIVVLAGWRGGDGLLVTEDAGGQDLLEAVTQLASGETASRRAKRALLRALGAEVARLHAAGFVHGDLVPPNLRWRDGGFVFLDNDRTRQLPLAVGARRNLVQLGRFVVPGLGVTDRARVLAAYADARGLGRRARRRLARWLIRKVTERRCAIDRIPPATAAGAGFRELMRSGGPFDPARAALAGSIGMPERAG